MYTDATTFVIFVFDIKYTKRICLTLIVVDESCSSAILFCQSLAFCLCISGIVLDCLYILADLWLTATMRNVVFQRSCLLLSSIIINCLHTQLLQVFVWKYSCKKYRLMNDIRLQFLVQYLIRATISLCTFLNLIMMLF